VTDNDGDGRGQLFGGNVKARRVARQIAVEIPGASSKTVDRYSDSFSLANRIFLSVSICCMISSPAVMLLNMIGAFGG